MEEPDHEFAWIGMLSAEPDLAERSAEILREEIDIVDFRCGEPGGGG